MACIYSRAVLNSQTSNISMQYINSFNRISSSPCPQIFAPEHRNLSRKHDLMMISSSRSHRDFYQSVTPAINCLALSDNGDASVSDERVTVLVIGSSGREHALCYALHRSSSCDAVFCAPGNAGIASSGDATCVDHLDVSDSSSIIYFSREWNVGLVILGPESSGLADDLSEAGILAFGPSPKAHVILSGSKESANYLGVKYAIPTAERRSFFAGRERRSVSAHFDETSEELVEEEEVSFFALVDGENAVALESARCYKWTEEADTCGMGAYSPARIMTKELETIIMEKIIVPTVKGMAKEGCRFVGVLNARILIDKRTGLPKLIGYDLGFGDPECQALMLRLESDLAKLLVAASRGGLSKVGPLTWSKDSTMVVVMASSGYPKEATAIIQHVDEAEEVSASNVKVFHGNTKLDSDGNFVVDCGGCVLGVAGKGKDLKEARERVYLAVEQIDWPEGFCRRDIGLVGEEILAQCV